MKIDKYNDSEAIEDKETKIYTINAKDSNKHIGWFVFNCNKKIIKTSYGNMDGEIKIDIYHIYPDSMNKPRLNQFFGSISSSSYLEARASISKSTTYSGFGGIYLEPYDLNGNRIGGLVMDTIINWLKQFDGSTIVNSIKYDPAKGQEKIVEAFYKKFSIPLSGETTIANLKTNNSWKKNIFEYDIENIFYEVWQSNNQIIFYENQNQILENLNKKVKEESKSWKSIVFGKQEYIIEDYFIPMDKNMEFYSKLYNLKAYDNIEDIINLFINYNSIERKLNRLFDNNKNLRNKLYQSNKINIKPLKFKYAFHKLFLNPQSFWIFTFLLIGISYKDYIISIFQNFIINK